MVTLRGEGRPAAPDDPAGPSAAVEIAEVSKTYLTADGPLEDDEEGIALGVELAAAALPEGRPKQLAMLGQRIGVALAESVEQFRQGVLQPADRPEGTRGSAARCAP
jgi:hypothetical protein